MHRRTFLATVPSLAATALAGCTNPVGAGQQAAARAPRAHVRAEAVDDRAIAEQVTHQLHDVQGTDRDERKRATLRNATGEGTGRINGTLKVDDPPIYDHKPVLFEGAVYEVSWEVVERVPATRFEIVLRIPQATPSPDEVVAWGDLPAVDREIIGDFAHDGGLSNGIGTTVVYTEAEVERSALFPEPARPYIRHPAGENAVLDVEDGYEEAVLTYEYDATEVYPSASALAEEIRANYRVTLEDLSAAEREVFEASASNAHGYTVPATATPGSGVRSLVDRLETHEQVRDAHAWLVAYEGTEYWVRAVIRPQSDDDVETSGDESGGGGPTTTRPEPISTS
jgi:hypothetical protein